MFCDNPTETNISKFNEKWYGLIELYENKYKYIFGNSLPCKECHRWVFNKFYFIQQLKN